MPLPNLINTRFIVRGGMNNFSVEILLDLEMAVSDFFKRLPQTGWLYDSDFLSSFNVLIVQETDKSFIEMSKKMSKNSLMRYIWHSLSNNERDIDSPTLGGNNQLPLGITSLNTGHTHEYYVDVRGNGHALEARHPNQPLIKHTHQIVNWRIQEAKSPCYPSCKERYGFSGVPYHNHKALYKPSYKKYKTVTIPPDMKRELKNFRVDRGRGTTKYHIPVQIPEFKISSKTNNLSYYIIPFISDSKEWRKAGAPKVFNILRKDVLKNGHPVKEKKVNNIDNGEISDYPTDLILSLAPIGSEISLSTTVKNDGVLDLRRFGKTKTLEEADNNINKDYFSEPFFSRDTSENLSVFFNMDVLGFMRKNAAYKEFLSTPKLQEQALNSVKINRIEIKRKRLDAADDNERTIAITKDGVNNRLLNANHQEDIENTIKSNSYNKSAQKRTIGGIAEPILFNDKGIRTFVITDRDVSTKMNGNYQYVAYVDIEDPTKKMLDQHINKVKGVLNILSEYRTMCSGYEEGQNKPYYKSANRSFSKHFAYVFNNSKMNTRIKDALKRFMEISTLMFDTKGLMWTDCYRMINPVYSNLELIDEFIDQVRKTVGALQTMKNRTATGRTNKVVDGKLLSRNSRQADTNIIRVRNTLKDDYNITGLRGFGQLFLNSGFSVERFDFLQRFDQEVQNYLGPDRTSVSIARKEIAIQNQKFSYLSATRILLDKDERYVFDNPSISGYVGFADYEKHNDILIKVLNKKRNLIQGSINTDFANSVNTKNLYEKNNLLSVRKKTVSDVLDRKTPAPKRDDKQDLKLRELTKPLKQDATIAAFTNHYEMKNLFKNKKINKRSYYNSNDKNSPFKNISTFELEKIPIQFLSLLHFAQGSNQKRASKISTGLNIDLNYGWIYKNFLNLVHVEVLQGFKNGNIKKPIFRELQAADLTGNKTYMCKLKKATVGTNGADLIPSVEDIDIPIYGEHFLLVGLAKSLSQGEEPGRAMKPGVPKPKHKTPIACPPGSVGQWVWNAGKEEWVTRCVPITGSQVSPDYSP